MRGNPAPRDSPDSPALYGDAGLTDMGELEIQPNHVVIIPEKRDLHVLDIG